jgi:WD40 repeat protein
MRASSLLSIVITVGIARTSTAAPPITALAFATGGEAVVVGSQAGLRVVSWPGLEPMRTLPTELAHIHDLAFAPRGDVLAAVGGAPAESGTIERFQWPDGRLLGRDATHDDLIHAVAWRPDSEAWATASLDRTVQVHSAAASPIRVIEGHSRGVLALGYLPDGRSLVSGGIDQSLRVWDAGSGRLVRRLDNHTGAILGLALRPGLPPEGPPQVVTIGADRTVRFWQPTLGRMVRLCRLPSTPLAVAWTEGGRSVATAGADGRVRIIDPDTVRIVHDLPALEGRAHSLAAAPDGMSLLVGGEGGQLRRLAIELPPITVPSGNVRD